MPGNDQTIQRKPVAELQQNLRDDQIAHNQGQKIGIRRKSRPRANPRRNPVLCGRNLQQVRRIMMV
jgi:hypothetical protein